MGFRVKRLGFRTYNGQVSGLTRLIGFRLQSLRFRGLSFRVPVIAAKKGLSGVVSLMFCQGSHHGSGLQYRGLNNYLYYFGGSLLYV